MNPSIETAIENFSERRRENKKWMFILCCFMLPCLLAMEIVSHSGKTVDPLLGKAAIEKYLYSNLAAIAVVMVTAAAFIIFVSKTFKGRESSIYQLIATLGGAAIIIYCGVSFYLSIHNISEDLEGPISASPAEYVLCSQGNGSYYIAFRDKGEYLLLAVPRDDYDKLRSGEPSADTDASPVYNLVTDAYAQYDDIELYKTDVTVEYYFNSAIYEGFSFA